MNRRYVNRNRTKPVSKPVATRVLTWCKPCDKALPHTSTVQLEPERGYVEHRVCETCGNDKDKVS